MSTLDGDKLIDQCKQHILAAMRTLPECSPDGPGVRARALEKEAGLALRLARAGRLAYLVTSHGARIGRQGRGVAHREAGDTAFSSYAVHLALREEIG